MKRYYEALGRDPFEVIPLTFHVKKGTDDPEFHKFMQIFKEIEVEMDDQGRGGSRESKKDQGKCQPKSKKNEMVQYQRR